MCSGAEECPGSAERWAVQSAGIFRGGVVSDKPATWTLPGAVDAAAAHNRRRCSNTCWPTMGANRADRGPPPGAGHVLAATEHGRALDAATSRATVKHNDVILAHGHRAQTGDDRVPRPFGLEPSRGGAVGKGSRGLAQHGAGARDLHRAAAPARVPLCAPFHPAAAPWLSTASSASLTGVRAQCGPSGCVLPSRTSSSVRAAPELRVLATAIRCRYMRSCRRGVPPRPARLLIIPTRRGGCHRHSARGRARAARRRGHARQTARATPQPLPDPISPRRPPRDPPSVCSLSALGYAILQHRTAHCIALHVPAAHLRAYHHRTRAKIDTGPGAIQTGATRAGLQPQWQPRAGPGRAAAPRRSSPRSAKHTPGASAQRGGQRMLQAALLAETSSSLAEINKSADAWCPIGLCSWCDV